MKLRIVLILILSLLFFNKSFAISSDTLAVSQELTELKKAVFKDPDGVRLKVEGILQSSLIENYPRFNYQAWMIHGTTYAFQGNFLKARNSYNKALQQAVASKEEIAIGNAKAYVGITFLRESKYSQALEYFYDGLKILEKYPGSEELGMLYLNLSALYYELSIYDDCIVFSKKAFKVFEKLKDDRRLAAALNNLGNAYLELTMPDTAFKYYNEALSYNIKLNNHLEMARNYQNIAEIYKSKGNTKLALNYLNFSDSVFDEKKYAIGRVSVKNDLARLYLKINQLDSANFYAKLAFNLSDSIHSGTHLQEASYTLYKINKLKNNLEEAFKWLEYNSSLKDSLINLEVSEKNNKLRKGYELIVKEYDNQQLRKQNDVNIKMVQNQRLNIIVVWFFCLVLLAVSAYSYAGNLKQKKALKELTFLNQHLDTQKTELEQMLKQIESQRRLSGIQKAKLEAADLVKNSIFNMIAHDIRGPIANLTTLIVMLREEHLSIEEFRELLAETYKISQNTLGMIESLFTWTRSQLEGFHPITEKILVKNILETAVNQARTAADPKDISINLFAPQDILVTADREILLSAIRNILANAIKFSHPGDNIQVNCGVDMGMIFIEIQDEGIGMDEGKLKRIMDSRIIDSTLGTAGEKGSGLGLILTKDFISICGGSLKVKSVPGKGSTFTIRLNKS